MADSETLDAFPAIYAMFVGPIDAAGAARLVAGLTLATKPENPKVVHLAMHSLGGNAVDGVMLHNTLRHMPLDLTVYNIGTVASAAAIAFVGAIKERLLQIQRSWSISARICRGNPQRPADWNCWHRL